MKPHWKPIFLVALVFLISFILAECKASVPVAGRLSGKLIDAVTGDPVTGATVTFAGYTATTASDGTFSIDLGQQTGALTGDFGLNASGRLVYLDQVCVDTARSAQFVFPFWPGTSAYPTHDVKVTIQKQGGTEISNGSSISLFVFNSSGGHWSSGDTTYTTGGMTFHSPTFGEDCLLVVFDHDDGFAVIQQEVLTGTSTEVTLTQDTDTTTSVSVSGDGSNMGGVVLDTPYGPALVGTFTLTSGAATVPVANPYNYPGYWVQVQNTSDLSSGSDKTLYSASGPAAIPTSLTLPAIDSSLGPTEFPDASTYPDTISYTGGVLSADPVSGASVYLFRIDETAVVIAAGNSVTLPSWMRSLLEGSTHNVAMGMGDSDVGSGLASICNLIMDQVIYGVSGPNIHFGKVAPSSPPPGNVYARDVAF
jgi:hypothetical protein